MHTGDRSCALVRVKLFKYGLRFLSTVSHSLPISSDRIHASTQEADDSINRVLAFIRQPKWEQNKSLKSIVSHMSPHAASRIIALSSNDTSLAVRFFRWVCEQSTYCYGLDSRIHLLNMLLADNLFVIVHKALIVLINQSCTSENDALKLIAALEDLRKNGFKLNYPCYSTFLMVLAKLDMSAPAVSMFQRMVGDGFIPGVLDYNTLINALCKSGLVQSAEMFLSSVVKLGLALNVHIVTSLVLGYCRAHDITGALRVFERMGKEDNCAANTVTFSIMIHGLCEAGNLSEAFRLKEVMCNNGCQPSIRTYTVLIKAVCDRGLTTKGFYLLDEMIKKGCEPNAHTYTILVDRLCRDGKMEEGNGLFRRMIKDGLNPGVVTYNTLINGYCKEGKIISAFELLGLMERTNCKPNIRTYNELIEGLCNINKPLKAMLLIKKIINHGLLPTEVTFNILVDGFCKTGSLDMAYKIASSMDSIGLEPDVFTYTMLIDGLCKEGKLMQAKGFLGLMIRKGLTPDEVTITALLNGYCKNGKIGCALRLIEKMITDKVLTSPHAFNVFLCALSKDVLVMQEKSVLAKMLKYGLDPCVVSYTKLVEGLCRAGDINTSFEILEDMKKAGHHPDVCTYTTVLNGLCKLGRLDEAEDLLCKMPDLGVFPNEVTYSLIIKSHVKSGRLDRALKVLGYMVQNGCQMDPEILLPLLAGYLLSESPSGTNTLPLTGPSAKLLTCLDGKVNYDSVFGTLDIRHTFGFLEIIAEQRGNIMDVYHFLFLGLCRAGRLSDADDLVQEMVKSGLPSDNTIEFICSNRNYDYSVKWMKLLLKKGCVPSFMACCSMILGLRSEGRHQEAQSLIYDLLKHAKIEDQFAVFPYLDFLLKEDQLDDCFALLNFIEQMHQFEKPII